VTIAGLLYGSSFAGATVEATVEATVVACVTTIGIDGNEVSHLLPVN